MADPIDAARPPQRSLFQCLERGMTLAREDGGMDPERARAAQAEFQRVREQYAREFDPATADAMAAEDVIAAYRRKTKRERRLALLQLNTARRLRFNVENHRNLRGEADAAAALPALLETDQVAGFDSVESRRQTLRGFYHSMMQGALRAFGRGTLGGVRNKAMMRDLVRALHGEAVEGPAAELAAGLTAAAKRARQDYNAAGGDIGELEDWGLPHAHNRQRIAAAGFEAWADAIHDSIDWSRMIDHDSGRPFAQAGQIPPRSRTAFLMREFYDAIIHEGRDKTPASFRRVGMAVANRRTRTRQIHFRNADAWLAYNERFGDADPFAAMVTHLDGMARDTAMMQVLGPNPSAGLEFAIQTAQRLAEARAGDGGPGWRDPSRDLSRAAHTSRAMLRLISGEANRPVDTMLAGFLSGARHLLVSAQLGGAMLSAVSDVGFQYAAARQISLNPGRVISRMLTQLSSRESRDQAIRMGLIADRLSVVGATQARYVGEAYAPEVARRLSEFTMRASGLAAWTEAGRHAFQLEFMGYLADHAHKPMDLLDEPFSRLLTQRGVTPEMWDQIRRAPVHVDQSSGATFIVPALMREVGGWEGVDADTADFLALKIMSIIHEQTEFAVPSATIRGRVALGGEIPPGTFAGELLRSGLMYKSFALSLTINQGRRLFMQPGKWGPARYAAAMFALLTVMGGASVQLKELAKGRDPRPMDSPEFLGAAVLQGGGLGIFGDFLSSETNRIGGGLGATLAGPVTGAAGDVIGLGFSTFDQMTGGDANAGRELVGMFRRYTPGGSLWYLSTALNRMGWDEVQRWVDPEADAYFRERERRRVRDFGNESWWRPGDTAPERAPEFSSALP